MNRPRVQQSSGRRRLLLLAGVLAAVTFVLVYRQILTARFRARLDQARGALESQNPFRALAILRPLLQSGRRDGELFVLAARCQRLAGSPDRCLGMIAAAGALDYEPPEAIVEAGLAMLALGRLREAEALLETQPTAESVAALTDVHLQMCEMDRALADLKLWMSLAPLDATPHFIRGMIWMDGANFAQAARDLRHAAELKPDFVNARAQLGAALIQLGKLDEAEPILVSCRAAAPDNEVAVLLARCQSELGKTSEAVELLRQVVARAPDHVAAMVALGKLELDEGEAGRAADLLRRAVAITAHHDAAWYNLALAERRLGRVDEADNALARWATIQDLRSKLNDANDRLKSTPNDVDVHITAGQLNLALGNDMQAERHFRAALRAAPGNATAQSALQRLAETRSAAISNSPAPGSSP